MDGWMSCTSPEDKLVNFLYETCMHYLGVTPPPPNPISCTDRHSGMPALIILASMSCTDRTRMDGCHAACLPYLGVRGVEAVHLAQAELPDDEGADLAEGCVM